MEEIPKLQPPKNLRNPKKNGIYSISTGAGFLSSTVLMVDRR